MFGTGVGVGFIRPLCQKKTLYGLILILGTFLAVWISINRSGFFLKPRHVIVLLPLFLVFISGGIVSIGYAVRSRWFSIGVCFVLLMAFLPVFRGFLAEELGGVHVLNEGAIFLRTSVGKDDTIIFSNPNMGGTFLYFLDPDAFFKIKDVYLHQGFNLFRFPQNFRALAEKGGIPIYALCSIDKESATMNRAVFEEVLKGKKLSGGRIWCVFNQVNYILEPNPFFPALGLKPEQLELKYPGIYLLKM
jgi:hypothetical protein